MSRRPSLQFYPGDWLRDSIAGCSLAAQGLWLRMMFLMHDSGRYGYLCTRKGSLVPSTHVAHQCGLDLAEYELLLAELDSVGVPSRTPEGILYSRRMVRDEERRAQFRKSKKKHKSNGISVEHPFHTNSTKVPHVSSSSSSSSIQKERRTSSSIAVTYESPPLCGKVESQDQLPRAETARDTYTRQGKIQEKHQGGDAICREKKASAQVAPPLSGIRGTHPVEQHAKELRDRQAIEARDRREQQEEEVRRAINVGGGPEVVSVREFFAKVREIAETKTIK